ncbi:MAG: hypothetical protein Q7S38_01295 [bacterium]|nr:hypothetical protein [bacterium]
MQSILITSYNEKAKEDYALNVCSDLRIDPFDINILEPKESKDKIGIEDVRILQKKMFLKPFRSPIKAALIKNAESLTPEAQNSLLKLIEEPPPNTIIILTASSKDSLLPTILSRCKIIELKDTAHEFSESEISQNLKILMSLSSAGIGEKLKLAQDLAKNLPAGRQGKEEAIVFLEKMILVSRQQMLTNIISLPDTQDEPAKSLRADQYLDILKSLQQTHTVLKTTNASPRLTLENLFLNL